MSKEIEENQEDGRLFADLVQPFLIDQTHLHGRFVRLSDVTSTIINRGQYPAPVATLLAELLALTAILGSSLKHEGIVTVQISGDGPVPLMVADCTAEGDVRGYADMAEDSAEMMLANPDNYDSINALMGKGMMVITLDPTMGKERYQGIVELSGESLTRCLLDYFKQSQQIDVAIHTFVQCHQPAKSNQAHSQPTWQAASMLVQRFPEEQDEGSPQIILPMDDLPEVSHAESSDDSWERTRMFLSTLTPDEMCDLALAPRDLLYRLFHEDGVWVYEAGDVTVGCRCTRERIVSMLAGMDESDLEQMERQGRIEVNCGFCNHAEVVTRQDINQHQKLHS